MECAGRYESIRDGLYCRTCGAFIPVGATLIIPDGYHGEHARAESGGWLPESLRWHFEQIAAVARYMIVLAEHGWKDTEAKRRYFASRSDRDL